MNNLVSDKVVNEWEEGEDKEIDYKSSYYSLLLQRKIGKANSQRLRENKDSITLKQALKRTDLYY